MFVALSSLLLAWTSSLGGGYLILGASAYWLMLVWLINFALRLVDDAANGVQKTATASVEMMGNPFLEARGVVHPTLAAALALLHYTQPQWPLAPTLTLAALLFPASIGATTLTGFARDSLNPVEMWRVLRGLGPWYPAVVLFVAGCALAAVLMVQAANFLQFGSRALLFMALQLMLLLAYAGVGAVLYMRRIELGFEPRRSPERQEAREDTERVLRRQQFIDGLYRDLRVRESVRATGSAREWLVAAPPAQLAGDVHAILAAGNQWQEPLQYPRLLRGLLPVLLDLRQPQLAMALATAGLAAHPDFAPADEATAVVLIGYALQTARRRAALQLLDNYLKSETALAGIGAPLAALRDTLRPAAS
jgi:hypothetical protein